MSRTRTAQQNDNLRVFANEFQRTTLVERFLQRPLLNTSVLITSGAPTLAQMALRFAANRDFEVGGTNMTATLCTHSTGGGIVLTTAGANADQAFVTPHLDSGQSSWATTDWSTDDEVAIGGKLKTGASISSIHLWAGLKLSNPATLDLSEDADAVFLYFGEDVDNTDGNWELCYSVAGQDYQIDTGVKAEASTSYEWEIAIDADRIARLYLGASGQKPELVVTTLNALTTGIDLVPVVGVENDGTAAAKALTVRALAISKSDND